MAPKCPFPTEECTQIVTWWCQLKDHDKVRWKYAKLKGIEKHPRQIPEKNVFKSVIDRFLCNHLNFFPYKINLTAELTERHKQIRVDYSIRILLKSITFPDRVIWTGNN